MIADRSGGFDVGAYWLAMRRSFKLALWAVLALLALPAFWTASIIWSGLQSERYYHARPTLQAMRQAYGGDSFQAYRARDLLLARFPPGTAAAALTEALLREDFHCQKVALRTSADPFDVAQERSPELARIDCQLLAPAQIGATRWIIDLLESDTGKLHDIRVRVWGLSA